MNPAWLAALLAAHWSVADPDMRAVCLDHGRHADCAALSGWDVQSQECIIWARTPRERLDEDRLSTLFHEWTACRVSRPDAVIEEQKPVSRTKL